MKEKYCCNREVLLLDLTKEDMKDVSANKWLKRLENPNLSNESKDEKKTKNEDMIGNQKT